MSGLLSKLFWFLLFTGATFCWYVLFEHGFGGGAYLDGVQQEWRNLTRWLSRGDG